MIRLNKKVLRHSLLCFLMLSLTAAAFAADDSSSAKKDSGAAAVNKTDANAVKPEILIEVAEKITAADKAGQQAEAKQIARDLKQIEVEKKELVQATAAAEKPVDAELLQAKLTLAERKKQLMESKAAFLQQKIQLQNLTHEKIKFLLTNVFSDTASYFAIVDELKRLRVRMWARLKDKALILRSMQSLSSRLQIEEQYLSTKKMLLSVSIDSEKAKLAETVAVAQERLDILRGTKALWEEKLQDVEFRLTALNEFNRLIRLRRSEVFLERVSSKQPLPFTAAESFAALVSFMVLAGLQLFQKKIAARPRIQSFFSTSSGVVFLGKALIVIGWALLAAWGVLSLLGYRAAAIALGLVFLNIVLGFSVFAVVKGSVESIFIRLFQRIAKVTQTEIKEHSPLFLLVRTVVMWIVFTVIFQQILSWWALRQEAGQWLSVIVNYPIYKSSKITVSIWALIRSLLVFWFFYLGSRFLNGILRVRVYPKSSLDKNSQYAIQSVIQFAFIVIGALAGIQLFGIDLGVLAVFSGTLGIGIGFGLQEIVKNIFSGFVIFFERPIRMGDVVEVGGSPGVVKSIRTRSTIVNTFDNISIVVPNSEFLTNRVVNWSHSDRTVRVESRVGVDYGSDPEKVKQTLLKIAASCESIMKKPEPDVVFEEFGDSALTFRLLYWVDIDDRMDVKSEVNFAIYAKFKQEGISIPFPQSDVHLKSCDFDLTQKKPEGA